MYVETTQSAALAGMFCLMIQFEHQDRRFYHRLDNRELNRTMNALMLQTLPGTFVQTLFSVSWYLLDLI